MSLSAGGRCAGDAGAGPEVALRLGWLSFLPATTGCGTGRGWGAASWGGCLKPWAPAPEADLLKPAFGV